MYMCTEVCACGNVYGAKWLIQHMCSCFRGNREQANRAHQLQSLYVGFVRPRDTVTILLEPKH